MSIVTVTIFTCLLTMDMDTGNFSDSSSVTCVPTNRWNKRHFLFFIVGFQECWTYL
ncbi:hypothetical protein KC19_VG161500 [Ceratodon purpureus]|uniref:Uncharacterized protein n=1 Tax=Ceratodon purpureus TaxID=3225 RepID=A0A8T0HR22_CERPU|nr:hypothetical protein KC19_VG161500 [Ceratodon purpureus]